MDSLDFLAKPDAFPLKPFHVLHGDEDLLRREARQMLEERLLDGADAEFSVSSFPGADANFSVVKSDLDTLPFLGPRRIVVIEQADPFVSEYRAQLERLADKPTPGTLILEVKTWPATTRLAKMLKDATIVCATPKAAQIPSWCVQRAQKVYGKKLSSGTAQELIDLIGPSLSLLDKELEKLATFVGANKSIGSEDVEQLVGRSRNEVIFNIFDSIGRKNSAEALQLLHRVFEQGDDPYAILGAFSWQLRKLAQVSRVLRTGAPMSAALAQAGVPPFSAARYETLLRHLGRQRVDELYNWLIEIDLGFKGNSALPLTMQLERLVVRLAQPAAQGA